MAAVATFTFTAGDTLPGGDGPVLLSHSVSVYEQGLAASTSAPAVQRATPRIVEAGVDSTTARTADTQTLRTRTPATRSSAAAPGGTCPAHPTTATSRVRQISTRELASRSTSTRSGAGISRLVASACRLNSSSKVITVGTSTTEPTRAAGASRPVEAVPALN